MSGKRIFIALDISDDARSVCSNHIEDLRKAFPQVRVGWERAEKLHTTLEFLGLIDARPLQILQERLTEVASRHGSFSSKLSSTGVFPSRSPARILWIGIDDASWEIAGVHREVRAVCGSLGLKGEDKPFKPHITVGRIREFRGSAELVARHLDMKIEPVGFKVSDIVIYESQLQPTGSVYSVVSRAQLSS